MAMADCTTQNAKFNRPTYKGVSLVQMIEVWRSRQALAKLDSHRLKDIGLTAKRAATEEARPIWDVPANWRS